MAFVDDYEHPVPNIFYIEKSIPSDLCPSSTESVQLHNDFNSQYECCNCESYCNPDTDCRCVLKCNPNRVINYSTSLDGESVLSDNALTIDRPVYECNVGCACASLCGNRLVQFGPRKGLLINNTPHKGLGLFTSCDIPSGGFVCEYAGEIITKIEAEKRHKLNSERKDMNYILCVNEHRSVGDKIQTFVDPSTFGNVGRYVNHSCAPNCAIVPIRVESPVPKLCIIAKRDIKPGEEITYSYGACTIVTENSVLCLCKSEGCREFLPLEEYN